MSLDVRLYDCPSDVFQNVEGQLLSDVLALEAISVVSELVNTERLPMSRLAHFTDMIAFSCILT